MFWAFVTTGVGRSLSYALSSAAAPVSVVMFPSSFRYIHQPTPAATRTRNEAASADQRTQRRLRATTTPSLGWSAQVCTPEPGPAAVPGASARAPLPASAPVAAPAPAACWAFASPSAFALLSACASPAASALLPVASPAAAGFSASAGFSAFPAPVGFPASPGLAVRPSPPSPGGGPSGPDFSCDLPCGVSPAWWSGSDGGPALSVTSASILHVRRREGPPVAGVDG